MLQIDVGGAGGNKQRVAVRQHMILCFLPMIFPLLSWLGFFATVAQVLLLRELLVAFEGNEISVGIVLTAWLAWTAFGSGTAGLVLRRRAGLARGLFPGALMLAGVAFPFTLAGARLLRAFLQTARGEVLGPVSILYSFLLLLPFCFLSGALFAASASRLLALVRRPGPLVGQGLLPGSPRFGGWRCSWSFLPRGSFTVPGGDGPMPS